jgi:hypothetical protein
MKNIMKFVGLSAAYQLGGEATSGIKKPKVPGGLDPAPVPALARAVIEGIHPRPNSRIRKRLSIGGPSHRFGSGLLSALRSGSWQM